MKVRIFIPSSDEDDAYNGSDHAFEVLPKVGERIRFTDFRQGDYVVTAISYIQDGDSFVAAVYTADPDKDEVDEWLASYKSSRP